MPRPSPGRWPEIHPLVLVPLALTVLSYHPIVRVFFFADDFVHLADLENESTLVFLLKPFGGNAFLARNLVFLGTYRLFGVDPVAFQWTVLLTHLLNVALLFGVLRLMTASVWLACVGATLWGVSPLNLDSLSWYSAFGHVLVGTALLLVLRGAARIDVEGGPIPVRSALLWFLLLLAGTTCYGPGIGAALVFPLAFVLLLPAAWRQRRVLLTILALPVATLALYYGTRYLFTLVGQLSIEEAVHQRAALSGFDAIPPFWGHLLAYSASGTVLGFFLSKAYPSPLVWSTLVVLVLALGVIVWRGSMRTRRLALAMLVLWTGIYLMIAAGRAHIYSLLHVPAVAAAMVGRYHYAGTIPLVIVVCLALWEVGRLPGVRAVPPGLAAVAGIGLVLTGWYAGNFRIDERRFAHDYYLYTKQDLATEIAAAPRETTLYLENEKSPPYLLGPSIPNRLFPGRAAVFLLMRAPAGLGDRDVRFIERDPEVFLWYRDEPGSPLARLLVAPEEPPPSP
jgi:hypothetical protein